MSDQHVGHLLDALDVTIELDDNEHIVDAIVIAKLAPLDSEDTTPRLAIAEGAGTDWITALGMLHAARAVYDEPAKRFDED